MNQYPTWKYILVAFVLLIGLIYAFPNLYPQVPAIQITPVNDAPIDTSLEKRLVSLLKTKEIKTTGSTLDEGKSLRISFEDTDSQLKARELVVHELFKSYLVALSLAPTTPNWLVALGASPMNLGLDLRGGVYLLLNVDTDGAVSKAVQSMSDEFRILMRENKVYYLNITHDSKDTVTLKFKNTELRSKADRLIRKDYNNLIFDSRDSEDGFYLTTTLNETAIKERKDFAVQQNITTMRKRINELGVAEPVVQRQGVDRIVIELPGLQDSTQAIEILSATATLEFRMVYEKGDAQSAAKSGNIPAGSRLLYERGGRPVLVKNRIMLTGEYITHAASTIDSQSGQPAVSVNLDGRGGSIFQRETKENVGKLMAVVFNENRKIPRVVDGKPVVENGKIVKDTKKFQEVISVATIREQLGRRFQITGLDSTKEAKKLALLLRAGALAADIDIVEERTVGPNLGKENISRGFKSIIVGFILVLIFMIVYYRIFGAVANAALMFNLIMIVAIMSILGAVFGASLTLPGIAGIVLTVGMAVDANVLIFERIREEIKNGNSPQASINAGYEKAFSTIFDANITTLIAAFVLFMFGTGPIKGFAVTLSIGILTSMFSAIMGTRAIINLSYGNRSRLGKLSI